MLLGTAWQWKIKIELENEIRLFACWRINQQKVQRKEKDMFSDELLLFQPFPPRDDIETLISIFDSSEKCLHENRKEK